MKTGKQDFPSGPVIKNPPANAGDAGSIPGSGRSPRQGKDNPLQYFCLGNPTDRGAWPAKVHGVAKRQTQLSNWTTTIAKCKSTFSFVGNCQTAFQNYCCWVTQSWLTPCDPMDCSTPGSPVLHHLRRLLRFMSIESVMPSNQLSSEVPFSSCLQSFPAPVSFLMSQLFASGGQSTGASASASVFPMTIQGWFPLRLTCLFSLQSTFQSSRTIGTPTISEQEFLLLLTSGSTWCCVWGFFMGVSSVKSDHPSALAKSSFLT